MKGSVNLPPGMPAKAGAVAHQAGQEAGQVEGRGHLEGPPLPREKACKRTIIADLEVLNEG